jgi:hypothetical protein
LWLAVGRKVIYAFIWCIMYSDLCFYRIQRLYVHIQQQKTESTMLCSNAVICSYISKCLFLSFMYLIGGDMTCVSCHSQGRYLV